MRLPYNFAGVIARWKPKRVNFYLRTAHRQSHPRFAWNGTRVCKLARAAPTFEKD